MKKDLNFRNRLTQACDRSPIVPAKHAGRLTFIGKHMGVSAEAVRRWFEGAKPRSDKMEALAKLCGVDTAWLSIGLNSEPIKVERERLHVQIEGAANVIIGLFTMAGAVCAVPDDLDPRKDSVDFYMIKGGRQYGISVSVGDQLGNNGWEVHVKGDYQNAYNIFLLRKGQLGIELLIVDASIISNSKIQDGSDYLVNVIYDDRGYLIDDTYVQRLIGIEDI
jgi:hypothetical protein